MDLISDTLLIAGTLGAAFYCFVLSRRLKRFNDLERGVGGAVAVLSAQVDDLSRTLQAAQTAANSSKGSLIAQTARAEDVARRLELILASMHDLPESAAAPENNPPPSPPAPLAARVDPADPAPTTAPLMATMPMPEPTVSHAVQAPRSEPPPMPTSFPFIKPFATARGAT